MIETDRLILRPWELADADALYRYASEPRVSEPALWPCHTSVDMSRWVIENIFRTNPHCYAMVLRDTLEPVGAIGLVPLGGEHLPAGMYEREVGYWIGLPHWNHGLTGEALRAFAAYCRDTLKLKSLLITTAATNAASQRVAEKCGFGFVGGFDCEGIASRAYRLTLDGKEA